MTNHLKTIPTKDASGEDNGLVVLIWNSATDYRPVGQVYVTTILPGKQKGPHLHMGRAGAFTVLVGSVKIVTRTVEFSQVSGVYGVVYREYFFGEGFKTVHVPAGTPCCLYNVGSDPAMVLNLPSAPYRDSSDEHSVEDWDYEGTRAWIVDTVGIASTV